MDDEMSRNNLPNNFVLLQLQPHLSYGTRSTTTSYCTCVDDHELGGHYLEKNCYAVTRTYIQKSHCYLGNPCYTLHVTQHLSRWSMELSCNDSLFTALSIDHSHCHRTRSILLSSTLVEEACLTTKAKILMVAEKIRKESP